MAVTKTGWDTPAEPRSGGKLRGPTPGGGDDGQHHSTCLDR
jgi:hypothetical protein